MLSEAIEQAKIDLERDGVARIPSVFTKREIDLARVDAIMALNKPYSFPGYGLFNGQPLQVRKVDGVVFPALLFFPITVASYLNKLRLDPRMVEIVTGFLGPNVKQLNNQVYYRFPGDNDEFAWHQDLIFRVPKEKHPNIETGYLQTIIVLDDITEDNGAVEFIPGSHKFGDLNLATPEEASLRHFVRDSLPEQVKDLPQVKYTAKAGDVLLWSCMTVHGSQANESARTRMTYMNGFAKAECSELWYPYTKDGKTVPMGINNI